MDHVAELAKAKLNMSFPKCFDPYIVKVTTETAGTLIFIRTRTQNWTLVPQWYAELLRDYCPFSDIISCGSGIIQYREMTLNESSC